MAKRKKGKKKQSRQTTKGTLPKTQIKPTSDKKKEVKKSSPAKTHESKNSTWLIIGVILLTALFFYPSLQNGTTNWDDDLYITDNKLLDIPVGAQLIKETFSQPVGNSYNPLVHISFAIDKQWFGGSHFVYHFGNYILHLLCTFLVFVFSRKLGLRLWGALLAAALFGLHPMRVESVAWVTERKDVLFASFFLLSMIFYLDYKDKKKPLFYVLAILSMILSGFSKIQAVSLPLCFIAIDYFRGDAGLLDIKTHLKKAPFFALSLFFGVLGVVILKEGGSFDSGTQDFGVVARFFLGLTALADYCVKFFVPYEYSAHYPYPPVNEALPGLYYVTPIIVAAFAFAVWRTKDRKIWAGALFFLANIVFLLQFVSAGSAFRAERFTYMAYLGGFMVLGHLLDNTLDKGNFPQIKYVALGLTVILGVVSMKRIAVWENSETLWTHIMEKFPEDDLPYNNRGHYYRKEGQIDKALADYNKALSIKPNSYQVLSNRAKIYFDQNKAELALEGYNKSLAIRDDQFEALSNRGAAFAKLGRYKEALQDFKKSEELKPEYDNLYKNRALTHSNMGLHEKAVADYQKYLDLGNANDAEIINAIAIEYRHLEKPEKSVELLTKCISLVPQNGMFYLNRSYAQSAMQKLPQALKDAQDARRLGYQVPDSYINDLTARVSE